MNRSIATRQKIVDAFTGLVVEGQLTPTAEQVARRADVGLRTVFRHFDDMDALYREISVDIDLQIQPLLRTRTRRRTGARGDALRRQGPAGNGARGGLTGSPARRPARPRALGLQRAPASLFVNAQTLHAPAGYTLSIPGEPARATDRTPFLDSNVA